LLWNGEVRQVFSRGHAISCLYTIKNNEFCAHVRSQVDALPKRFREKLCQHPTDKSRKKSEGDAGKRHGAETLGSVHRSPGHQVDGGSFAEIFVGRSATRWLRLYG